MGAEPKVASVHQSVQASSSTYSAPHFCNKVQIPEIPSNLDKSKLASVHCWKLRGLEG